LPTKNRLVSDLTQSLRADSGTAAPDAVAIWVSLANKFGPLIGHASVAMLVARSLAAHRTAFPWLDPVDAPGMTQAPYPALRSVLESRSPDEVVTVTRAMLATYTGLLDRLIGARLAGQLVRAALAVAGATEDNRSQPE
jgi:hypothetical protein